MATNNRWPLQDEQAGPKRPPAVSVAEFDDGVSEKNETLVVGTTNLYVDGQLRLIPVSLAYPFDAKAFLTTCRCPRLIPRVSFVVSHFTPTSKVIDVRMMCRPIEPPRMAKMDGNRCPLLL